MVLKINAVDKTSLVSWRDLVVEYNATKEPDICLFSLKQHAGQTYKPVVNDTMEITEGVKKIFAGRIIEVKDIVIGGKLERVEISAKDWTFDLDRKMVVEVYENKTAEFALTDVSVGIIPKYTSGFTSTNVKTGAGTIKKIKFNYEYPSRAIQKIADLFGWDWYVDFDKDVHFFLSETRSAPFEINETDKDGFIKDSFEMKADLSQVKNSVYVRGGIKTESLSAANSEKYNADGQRTVFSLGHKFLADTAFTVKVAGVDKSEGLFGKDDPNNFDVLYDPNRPAIIFRENNKPTNGQLVEIFGTYELPIVLYRSDQTSIDKYGEFQFRIVDENIKSKDEASQKAAAELRKYSERARSGGFKTYKDGLEVGMEIVINLPSIGINDKFKIQKIKRTIHTPNDGTGATKYLYEVDVVASEIMGSIDVLARLLVDDVNRGLVVEDNEILDTVYGFIEAILLTEGTWNVVVHPKAVPDFSETLAFSSNDRVNPWGVNNNPIWVAGDHYPADGLDQKRVPRIDAGLLVQ